MFSIHSASPETAEVSKSDLKGEYHKHLLMVKNIRKLSFGSGSIESTEASEMNEFGCDFQWDPPGYPVVN